MTTQTEVLTLALEALEKLVRFESDSWELGSCRVAGRAIKAIKEALAQPEPVDYEKLAALGWQEINCPICGGCARAFPKPEQEPALNPEDCAKDVFEHGTSMGLFVMPKEEAEQYCKDETKRTGYKHDWHYVAGRVHVKALIPAPQRKPLTDEEVRVLYKVSTGFDFHGGSALTAFIRAIEAAHGIKEKNT